MKFNAYILEKYGMTKEVYNSKPDWAKEELHKEHETYIREMQIQEAEERRWENMSESEREREECYNNLVGDGIPQAFIDQIFGD